MFYMFDLEFEVKNVFEFFVIDGVRYFYIGDVG